MSLVMSVQRSFPCAHPCDDPIVSSRSEASSRVSIVTSVCDLNSRIASRTVAAMVASWGGSGGPGPGPLPAFFQGEPTALRLVWRPVEPFGQRRVAIILPPAFFPAEGVQGHGHREDGGEG